MRATVARRIRRDVYGGGLSPRNRKYLRNTVTGQIISDGTRQAYQQAKKLYSQQPGGKE